MQCQNPAVRAHWYGAQHNKSHGILWQGTLESQITFAVDGEHPYSSGAASPLDFHAASSAHSSRGTTLSSADSTSYVVTS